MEDNHLLNKDYIKIKNMNIVSYGGNQTWLERKHLSNYGCGIVAMADLSIYLAEQNPNMMTDAIMWSFSIRGMCILPCLQESQA